MQRHTLSCRPGPASLTAIAALCLLILIAPVRARIVPGHPSAPDPAPGGEECTIAVVSGAATPDGRPLLWKNRDTGRPPNEVVYFADGKLRYLALVTAGETGTAWLGVNEAGFGIGNALSYNLADSSETGISNGALMKMALQRCVSVAAFESLLIATNGSGRTNPANLGVIDARGGAALFEVGSHTFTRFDADDPVAAPNGILVRANFSLAADTLHIDTWRFRRARQLVTEGALAGGVDLGRLLRTARDLRTAATDPYPLPFLGAPPEDPEAEGRVNTDETINRRSTVSAGVIEGVRPGEDPAFATFYAMLGQPVVAPAVPLWVAAGTAPPEVDGPATSPLCDVAMARQAVCYDVPRRHALLNTHPLVEGDAFLTRVERIEEWLLPETATLLERWRAGSPDPLEMRLAEQSLTRRVYEEYAPDRAPVARRLVLSPNPTRGPTLVLYPVGRGGDHGIEVYDVSGRALRTIPPAGPARFPDGTRPASLGSVLWDGRDGTGRRVPSGVYFVRARGAAAQTGRIVVIR